MANSPKGREDAQEAQRKALERAEATLKAKGVGYPIYDTKLSPEANHERLEAYSLEVAALVYQYLNETPAPRPLVLDNTEPKRQYGNSYYDD